MQKLQIIEHLKKMLDERVQVAWNAMQAAQASANEESKSSAGDKYETARAMAQNERDRHAQQYELARLERLQLERLPTAVSLEKVEPGALVTTQDDCFFIAVSVGAIMLEQQRILVVSPASPIGNQLIGKKAGDQFVFKGKPTFIISVS
ncbi:MAG: transcription elongation factor [Siphonobacter sp.]